MYRSNTITQYDPSNERSDHVLALHQALLYGPAYSSRPNPSANKLSLDLSLHYVFGSTLRIRELIHHTIPTLVLDRVICCTPPDFSIRIVEYGRWIKPNYCDEVLWSRFRSRAKSNKSKGLDDMVNGERM
jgi:hypothetical protein